MVVWVLQRALEALEVLPPHYRKELVEELAIRDDELDRWREMTRKMKVVFHADGVTPLTASDLRRSCSMKLRERASSISIRVLRSVQALIQPRHSV